MFICEGKFKGKAAAIRWDKGEVYPVDEIRNDALVLAVRVAAINAIGRYIPQLTRPLRLNHSLVGQVTVHWKMCFASPRESVRRPDPPIFIGSPDVSTIFVTMPALMSNEITS